MGSEAWTHQYYSSDLLFWVPNQEDVIPLSDHLAVGRQRLVRWGEGEED